MAITNSGLILRDDESDIGSEQSAGRVGRNFNDLSSENTASLGIKKSITEISRSVNDFLGDDADRTHGEFADAFQFVTAKVYENREAIGKISVSASINGVSKAKSADTLATARTIGGVSFDGSGNINLPGVNARGDQDTTGNAATATILETARTIGGVSFNGSGNINLPGVNTGGNQNTSGNAATATLATDATTLATSRAIGGVNFDGSAAIIPKQHKGSITAYYLTPTDFESRGTNGTSFLTSDTAGRTVTATAAGIFVCNVTLPIGLSPTHVVIYGSDTGNTVNVYVNNFNNTTTAQVDGGSGFVVGTNTSLTFGKGSSWASNIQYLTITVTTDGTDSIYGGIITMT